MTTRQPSFDDDVYLIELADRDGDPFIPETSALSASRDQLVGDIFAGFVECPARIIRMNVTRRECAEADTEIAALVGQLSIAARKSPNPVLCEWLDERGADYCRDGDYYARKREEEAGRRTDEVIDDRRDRGLRFTGFGRRLLGL